MSDLCPDDGGHRARLRYLTRWLARLTALGDANGICGLFDEIIFDYDEEDAQRIVGWHAH